MTEALTALVGILFLLVAVLVRVLWRLVERVSRLEGRGNHSDRTLES